jgi:hypothetical protein
MHGSRVFGIGTDQEVKMNRVLSAGLAALTVAGALAMSATPASAYRHHHRYYRHYGYRHYGWGWGYPHRYYGWGWGYPYRYYGYGYPYYYRGYYPGYYGYY